MVPRLGKHPQSHQLYLAQAQSPRGQKLTTLAMCPCAPPFLNNAKKGRWEGSAFLTLNWWLRPGSLPAACADCRAASGPLFAPSGEGSRSPP